MIYLTVLVVWPRSGGGEGKGREKDQKYDVEESIYQVKRECNSPPFVLNISLH